MKVLPWVIIITPLHVTCLFCFHSLWPTFLFKLKVEQWRETFCTRDWLFCLDGCLGRQVGCLVFGWLAAKVGSWLAGWVGGLVGWLNDWLIGLVGYLVDWLSLLVGICWVVWLAGWLAYCLAGSDGWLADWLVGWLASWLVNWLIDWVD